MLPVIDGMMVRGFDAGRLSYSAMMVLATTVAAWLLRRQQSSLSLTTAQKWGIAIGGFVGATFGAKLPFVLAAGLSAADQSIGLAGAWLGDGKTVLWGLAGGYIGVEIAKWSLYIRSKTGDSFVIPVAVAIAIGRLGCFLYGCCYGIATDQSWGVRSMPADSGRLLRHPAPLYEITFHLSFALLAGFAARQGWLRHQWMLLYLISYATFRFVSEWWREEPNWIAGFTFYQCSAVVIGSGFAALLVWRMIRKRSSDWSG